MPDTHESPNDKPVQDNPSRLVDDSRRRMTPRKNSNDPRNGAPPGGNGNKWRRKNLSLLLGMVLLALILVQLLNSQSGVQEKNYSEFRQMMADTSLVITSLKLTRISEGFQVQGERALSREEQANQSKSQADGSNRTVAFHTVLPEWGGPMQDMLDSLARRGVKIEFTKETRWFGYMSTLLPLFLLIGFFWFMMSRQGQMGGGRGIFSFGKIKARVQDDNRPKVTFVDVAGCDEAKQELQEIIEFLKDPTKFSKLGGRIPKGVLLLGPPGTGKTLLAKAVAGEADVPFFSMSGSDFVEMFVGVGASRVRDLFEQGKKNAPCIVFIDEIDAVGRHRGAGLGGGHDEREQTLNQLLVEMDGFTGNDGVILIAATNRADVLDPALLRPGRFDRQVVVDLPDSKGREGVLRVHLNKRKIPLHDDVDISKIAKGTPGLAGADLENLVNEACLLAARFGGDKVAMIDFEEAKDKVMIGNERFSRILTEEEKKTTAIHEAGHAIVSLLVEHSDPLHKITIIPRGRALGITFQLPEKDRYTVDSRFILDKIAILMGGRVAEQVFLGQMTTGASNDIERATDLARKFVCEFGMSDLGPISFGKKQEEIFLGREINTHRDFSEATAIQIDREVRKIIDGQLERVQTLIAENRQKLQNLADALLEHEVLEADEIQKAMAGELMAETRKSRSYLKTRGERAGATAAPSAQTTAPALDAAPAATADASQPASGEAKDKDAGKGNAIDTVA
jgi:cell division protease FtsH